MNIRESMEQRELELLSPYAAHSGHSRGRERPEEECDVRTVYQRDRDRILHSKAFRRLKDKTQVFLAPQGDHYRNRLTHTLEVSQIARTIAKALRLNEDLVEAIALGHDLGHTPFGHAGERALDQVNPDGFAHFRQSVRVVEVLEKNGIEQDEIGCFLLHQANRRIVEAVARRLNEPVEKFPMNLREYGNTSSASIPLLLDELNRAGSLKRGSLIVLAGFGAGLTWGASVIRW